jgi:transcriptional regulator with XRE-family HTH domain
MDLPTFLAQARERHSLSYRSLEKRADDLSHAYIWRLEKGEKGAPSPATIQKLSTALQLSEREQKIFELLVNTSVDDVLYNLMMKRHDIPWEEFETVATMSFRGQRPSTEEQWVKRIEIIRDL